MKYRETGHETSVDAFMADVPPDAVIKNELGNLDWHPVSDFRSLARTRAAINLLEHKLSINRESNEFVEWSREYPRVPRRIRRGLFSSFKRLLFGKPRTLDEATREVVVAAIRSVVESIHRSREDVRKYTNHAIVANVLNELHAPEEIHGSVGRVFFRVASYALAECFWERITKESSLNEVDSDLPAEGDVAINLDAAIHQPTITLRRLDRVRRLRQRAVTEDPGRSLELDCFMLSEFSGLTETLIAGILQQPQDWVEERIRRVTEYVIYERQGEHAEVLSN